MSSPVPIRAVASLLLFLSIWLAMVDDASTEVFVLNPVLTIPRGPNLPLSHDVRYRPLNPNPPGSLPPTDLAGVLSRSASAGLSESIRRAAYGIFDCTDPSTGQRMDCFQVQAGPAKNHGGAWNFRLPDASTDRLVVAMTADGYKLLTSPGTVLTDALMAVNSFRFSDSASCQLGGDRVPFKVVGSLPESRLHVSKRLTEAGEEVVDAFLTLTGDDRRLTSIPLSLEITSRLRESGRKAKLTAAGRIYLVATKRDTFFVWFALLDTAEEALFPVAVGTSSVPADVQFALSDIAGSQGDQRFQFSSETLSNDCVAAKGAVLLMGSGQRAGIDHSNAERVTGS